MRLQQHLSYLGAQSQLAAGQTSGSCSCWGSHIQEEPCSENARRWATIGGPGGDRGGQEVELRKKERQDPDHREIAGRGRESTSRWGFQLWHMCCSPFLRDNTVYMPWSIKRFRGTPEAVRFCSRASQSSVAPVPPAKGELWVLWEELWEAPGWNHL